MYIYICAVGSEEKLATLRKDYYQKYGDLGCSAFRNAAATMLLAMGGDPQSTLFDSTTTVSDNSSLANNINRETNHEEHMKARLPFFDFLGVGST